MTSAPTENGKKVLTMHDLKPCSCGGKTRCVSIPFTHDKYMVMCFNEGCGTSQDKWYGTKEEAIEAWNCRAGEGGNDNGK